jgi:hypothetical protein
MTSSPATSTPTHSRSRKWVRVVLPCVLTLLAMISLGHQRQNLRQRTPDVQAQQAALESYKKRIDNLLPLIAQNRGQTIDYLQGYQASSQAGAVRTMTQYLVAPMILRDATRESVMQPGPLLVNLQSDAQAKSFASDTNRVIVERYAPGLVLTEGRR